MANLLRFDFNDRDGIVEVVENGDWVRATDYDALTAKLAVVEAELIDAEAWLDYLWGQTIKNRRRADAAEAALPAVYQLALGDGAQTAADIASQYVGYMSRVEKAIRAQPTPTAAELMARIQTGEKDE